MTPIAASASSAPESVRPARSDLLGRATRVGSELVSSPSGHGDEVVEEELAVPLAMVLADGVDVEVATGGAAGGLAYTSPHERHRTNRTPICGRGSARCPTRHTGHGVKAPRAREARTAGVGSNSNRRIACGSTTVNSSRFRRMGTT